MIQNYITSPKTLQQKSILINYLSGASGMIKNESHFPVSDIGNVKNYRQREDTLMK